MPPDPPSLLRLTRSQYLPPLLQSKYCSAGPEFNDDETVYVKEALHVKEAFNSVNYWVADVGYI